MIKPATWADICRVAAAMKPDHARSACALAGTDDPLQAIQRLALAPYVAATIWRGDEPIVAAGAIITHPGVASTFMYATDRWPEAIIETTRFFHRTLRNALIVAGVHRLQTLAIADDPMSERWKRFFGSMPEATFSKYGKNGEDFTLFVCHLQDPVGVTHVVN